jgi:hypothetical protein
MLNTINLKNPTMQSAFLPDKRKLFLFLASASLLLLTGCGNKKGEDTNTELPAGMIMVDLSKYNLPILITVPDSANGGSLEITENGQGGVDLKSGKNVQITIAEGPGDMALKKNDATTDAVRKFVKYVSEEPDAILWEWQIPGLEPEFHFYTLVKAGNKSFEVQDVNGKVFSETAAKNMLNAAKTIRMKTQAS